MAGALQAQLEGDLPVKTALAHHFGQVMEQCRHLRPAVPEGVQQTAGVVKAATDVRAAVHELLHPFVLGQRKEVPGEAVIASEFRQAAVGPRLTHDAVPAVLIILPAELLHQRRGVKRMIDRRAVKVQLLCDLSRLDPVAAADCGADGSLCLICDLDW